jgi:hypothetical protein
MLNNSIVYPFVYYTAASQMMLKSDLSVPAHQKRAEILGNFEDAFPVAGNYLFAELSRTSGAQDGLDRVKKSALGLWKLAKYANQTDLPLDDFCV